MAKLIALQSAYNETISDAWHNDFSNLKQKSLLFNQVGIFRLSNFYKLLKEASIPFEKINPNIPSKVETIIAELEWLKQLGVIFELTLEAEFNDKRITIPAEKQKDAENLLSKIAEIQEAITTKTNNDPHKMQLINEQYSAILRLMSIIMEITKGVTVVTTTPYTDYVWEFPNVQKSSVAQIVISKLPLPNNGTPWEQIIDYRNDSENQKNLLNLRRWIRKISTEDLALPEIEEELEWLMNEFQSHMNLHKMKANTETLEVMVKAPLEVI
ncbi:MAG: hypothetical protein Q8O48_11865, partial [Anaerolineales bacterium]|nr:hypothetical protein [Anaerolineales bacterium]